MWVIDFEASGLHRSSYPIQVGVTNGRTEFQSLIRPMGHWQFWDDEAEQVHGLERSLLNANGVAAAEVALQLNELLAGRIVYCDAIQWDGFWARVLFSDNGLHQRFKLADVTSLFETDTQIEKFLAERTRLESSGQYHLHHAIDDARILWRSLGHALDKHC